MPESPIAKSSSAGYRVGIDVGGTNTDAVILDRELRVLAKYKSPTTSDVVGGIQNAMQTVLESAGVHAGDVARVMLGTTHATNAILERRELSKVAVVRIAGPAGGSIPPLATWPGELRETVSAGEVIVDGGFDFDGSEHVPFGEEGLRDFLDGLAETPDAFAIISMFASVSDAHEQLAANIVREKFGDTARISLSSSLGSIGLLERENACVLNAALFNVAESIVDGLREAAAGVGIDAATYFAQNDGTLMAMERVLDFPVLTIGSGPANSMRGAAHLSSLSEAIVIDVGGTSTDIGVLASGFPRESAIPVDIGGVRTNFRMPDLLAIALGGGTIVDDGADEPTVGPASIGHRLETEAVVFGGSTTTLSDMAVRTGRAVFGDVEPVAVDPLKAEAAMATIDQWFTDGVDRMKLSRSPQPVIAVGGGSVLVPDTIEGASEVIRPENFDVANAIGAAIALVSTDIDQFFSIDGQTREEVIEQAKADAIGAAVAIGADPSMTEIISLEELTMAYMTNNVLRLRIKAAGPLA